MKRQLNGPIRVCAPDRLKGCKQGAILGLQPGPWMLATQDREFVTQDQDLDFLGLSRLAAEHDQLKDVAQRQVEE